jgi:tetratricopeptide (TPR) repeat protein
MRRGARCGRRSYAAALPTIAAVLLGLTGAAAGAAVGAAPYRPTDDGAILERVPARSELERLAPLRAAVAVGPKDLAAARALATGYISIGRRNSDPRFIAYAEATLEPWLAQPHPPESALVLQAIALQYLHRFDAALALLDRALAQAPLDGQAWLTRAALLELRGDYAGARRACARLVRAADEFTALTCLRSVAGRSGQLAESYAALEAAADLDPAVSAPLRAWRLAVMAEMAERLGDDRAAEAHLTAALRAASDDPYLKASYADLLLRLARAPEVIALLSGSEAQDPLLLRLAIAGRRVASPQAERWAQAYEARLAATERDGDTSHRREQALYLLEVRGDARAALRAAAANWSVQREPADLRVYAAAARRAHSDADRAVIAAWVGATRYEDRILPAEGSAAAGQQP